MIIQVVFLGCISDFVSTTFMSESDCLNGDVGDTGDDKAKLFCKFTRI